MSTVKYTKDHEWIRIDGDIAWIGITAYARHALGDLVYLELPENGRSIQKGDHFAVVESVKAASEIYTPVTGAIVAVNDALSENLDDLKEDLDKGWIIKVKMTAPDEAAALLDKSSYDAFTESLS